MKIRTINNHCVMIIEETSKNARVKATVFSYDTPVVRMNDCGDFERLWDGWSATTQRDINAALKISINKKMWESMPVVD